MAVEATKTTSFIAGVFIAVSGIIIEAYSLPWLINAIVFFPVMFFLVIGREIHREYKRGMHISNTFYKGPIDAEGWRIYGRCIARMFIWLLGVVSAEIAVGVANGI